MIADSRRPAASPASSGERNRIARFVELLGRNGRVPVVRGEP